MDIKGAYLHILLSPCINTTCALQHYQFVAFPFGLSTVPWDFTKVSAPILALLHCPGIPIKEYLDDLFLKSVQAMSAKVHRLLQALYRFEWILNVKRSALESAHHHRSLDLPIGLTTKNQACHSVADFKWVLDSE